MIKATKTADLSRLDWLRLRQTGIGGSDISAIMGINPYKSAYDLYCEKTSQIADSNVSEAAYWGILLEDVVAKEYAKRNEVKVQRVNYLIRHEKHDWAIANIDRAIVNKEIAGNVRIKDGKLTTDKLLEVKTASEYVKKNWGDEHTDQVPDHYNLQCQWYMGITKVYKCDLALLLGGNKFKQYHIDFDEELFEMMLEQAEDFWVNHVLAGVPPTATTLQNVRQKYPKADIDSTLDLPSNDNQIDVIDTYFNLKDEEKQLQDRLAKAQVNLIELVGNHEALAIDGEVILTYKNQKGRETFDKKTCLKSHPELANIFCEFTKTSQPTRVLRRLVA